MHIRGHYARKCSHLVSQQKRREELYEGTSIWVAEEWNTAFYIKLEKMSFKIPFETRGAWSLHEANQVQMKQLQFQVSFWNIKEWGYSLSEIRANVCNNKEPCCDSCKYFVSRAAQQKKRRNKTEAQGLFLFALGNSLICADPFHSKI